MNANENTARKDEHHISLNDLATQVRQDSDNQDPILRELELNAQLRICDLLANTGIVRIPAIAYGAILAERDRVSILADNKKS